MVKGKPIVYRHANGKTEVVGHTRQDRRPRPEWITTGTVLALCIVLLVMAALVGGLREDVRLQERRIERLEVAE